jgi:hypothetical protein
MDCKPRRPSLSENLCVSPVCSLSKDCTDDLAEFCDAQLPLFFAIMERSKNPIIRSNAVIALGDMVSNSSGNTNVDRPCASTD